MLSFVIEALEQQAANFVFTYAPLHNIHIHLILQLFTSSPLYIILLNFYLDYIVCLLFFIFFQYVLLITLKDEGTLINIF